MTGFKKHTGLVVPLNIANIDTDVIIPKQFLQKINKTGFGQHLFHDWRFLDNLGQQLNPEFIMNKSSYRNASILLTRENFGCGSSREHAPWALSDYGIKVIISSSFADIFYNNAINNQLIPVRLTGDEISELFEFVGTNDGVNITVDLENMIVEANNKTYSFDIDSFRRHCLLNGLDNIGLTLLHEEKIHRYELNIPHFLE